MSVGLCSTNGRMGEYTIYSTRGISYICRHRVRHDMGAQLFRVFFCLFVSPLFERRSPKRGNRLVIWKFRHRATLLYSTLSHKNVSLFAVPKVDG